MMQGRKKGGLPKWFHGVPYRKKGKGLDITNKTEKTRRIGEGADPGDRIIKKKEKAEAG